MGGILALELKRLSSPVPEHPSQARDSGSLGLSRIIRPLERI